MRDLQIIILAAGKGKRMNSCIPKVFHEVANHPMIFHILDTIKNLSPTNINIVISKELNNYKSKILNNYSNIDFTIQKEQIGTADAVKSVKNKTGNTTLILYADSPLLDEKSLKKLVRNVETKFDLSILTMLTKNNKNYGRVIVNKDNSVKKIVEFLDASNNEKKIKLCNSGVMAIKTIFLDEYITAIKNDNKKKEFYLTDLVEIFNKNKLKVGHQICEFEETLGVNDREDLILVESVYQKKKQKRLIAKGITILDPNSSYFSFDTEIKKDSIIFPNVYFGKRVEVGKNVKIKSFSHIEGTKISDNCEVGPFARIRPSSKLDKNVRVGNFVEIKESKINKDSKISHLSYIGDALIGQNTNIGAGTITCNFDGKLKHKTIIGDNCFIGSNSSLIAPIRIKKNSLVGAGTVTNKNVDSDTTVFRKSELIQKKKK